MRGDSFFLAQVAMIYCLGVMQLPQNKEAMVGSIINCSGGLQHVLDPKSPFLHTARRRSETVQSMWNVVCQQTTSPFSHVSA